MSEMSEEQMLEKLRRFDTPSITNIVATYPDDPLVSDFMTPGKSIGIPINRSAVSIRNWG
jgi:hypothetical protein